MEHPYNHPQHKGVMCWTTAGLEHGYTELKINSPWDSQPSLPPGDIDRLIRNGPIPTNPVNIYNPTHSSVKSVEHIQ